MSSDALRIRAARPDDYAVYTELVPELRVPDPIVDEPRFVHELMPSMLVAEAADATRPVGYVYFQILKEEAYVRHIVAAPYSRRRGVGRALMDAVAERARAARCASWCLNVKPDNVPAIALYESVGLRRAYTSCALRLMWSALDRSGEAGRSDVVVRDITPADDERVERTMKLARGQLAESRTFAERVLLLIEEKRDGERNVVGVAVFKPSFPGASPFRVTRPDLAFVLLRAIRPHARAEHAHTDLFIEDASEVAEALIAAGATIKLDIVHMKGPLPRD